MKITHLTILQDGEAIGNVAIKEQAVNAAKTRAVETGKPVSVVAHLDDGRGVREVVFKPDGTNEKIWDIDKGWCMEPIVDHIYTNRGGGQYRCIAQAAAGPIFYTGAGGFSDASGVFQNIKSGWTFKAKGIIQYIDGTIEWDHSADGRFEQIAEH